MIKKLFFLLFVFTTLSCQNPKDVPIQELSLLISPPPNNLASPSQVNTDTIHLNIEIKPLDSFRTQGVNLNDIHSFKARVIGPGIKNAIWNKGGVRPITGTTMDLEIPNVPKGRNRVVVAEAFDYFNNHLFDLAGHYSSPQNGNQVVVKLERRFGVLARLMEEWLKSSDRQALYTIGMLDMAGLQNMIEDGLLYNTPPQNEAEANTFQIDPTLVKPKPLLDLIQSQGNHLTGEILRSKKEELVQGKSTATFIVDEKGNPLQDIQVTISNPTAPDLKTDAQGRVSFSSLPEGEWRIVGTFPNSEALEGSPRSFGTILVSHETTKELSGSPHNPLVRPTMLVKGLRLENVGAEELVYIEGSGFKPHQQVLIDGQKVNIAFLNDSRIEVILPAGTINLGTSKVKVVDENQESNTVQFKNLASIDTAENGSSAGDTRNQDATQKALDYLSTNAVNWDNSQNCYGCHVQAQAARALAIGVGTNYNVNLGVSQGDGDRLSNISGGGLRQLMDRLLRAQRDNNGYLWHTNNAWFVSSTMQAAPAYAAYSTYVDNTYDTSLTEMVDWLVTSQQINGSWVGEHTNFPIEEASDLIQSTTNNLLVMRRGIELFPNNAAYQNALTKGVNFLRSQKNSLNNTQKIVHFILGLRQAGQVPSNDPDLIAVMEQLSNQRVDMGGNPQQYAWKYDPTYCCSTPYASGQALAAMKAMDINWFFEPTRGQHTNWVESYRGVYEWLLATQGGDGSWAGIGTASKFAQTMWPAIGLASASVEPIELTIIEPKQGNTLKGKIPVVFKLKEKLLPPNMLQQVEIQINGNIVKIVKPGDPEWDSLSPSEAVVKWGWDAGNGIVTNVDLKVQFKAF